jgi:predicted RNA-binding Zn-ribbon protein involved in translation (DUF1610 family)
VGGGNAGDVEGGCMSNVTTPERIIAGEATCKSCDYVWFLVAPEIAEPPYECPKCGQSSGYCSHTWKVYGTILECDEKSTIWIDGYSRRFEGETLMQACIPLKQAVEHLIQGDTSLFEVIA